MTFPDVVDEVNHCRQVAYGAHFAILWTSKLAPDSLLHSVEQLVVLDRFQLERFLWGSLNFFHLRLVLEEDFAFELLEHLRSSIEWLRVKVVRGQALKAVTLLLFVICYCCLLDVNREICVLLLHQLRFRLLRILLRLALLLLRVLGLRIVLLSSSRGIALLFLGDSGRKRVLCALSECLLTTRPGTLTIATLRNLR